MTPLPSNNDFTKAVRDLLDSWLDSVFGPLYHFTYRIKLSRFHSDPPEVLLLNNPALLYSETVQIFDSELIAESFMCTFLRYSRELGLENPPPCNEFIRWFKNNDIATITSFLKTLLELRSRRYRIGFY
ncbi:MAG: hypothetical protein QXO98_04040 [Sulfolobales archaeon]